MIVGPVGMIVACPVGGPVTFRRVTLDQLGTTLRGSKGLGPAKSEQSYRIENLRSF